MIFEGIYVAGAYEPPILACHLHTRSFSVSKSILLMLEGIMPCFFARSL